MGRREVVMGYQSQLGEKFFVDLRACGVVRGSARVPIGCMRDTLPTSHECS